VVAMAALTFEKFGGTRHVWDIIPSTIPELLQYSLATQLVFGQAVTFIKISMLLLTRKIMGNGSKTIRNIITFGIVYVVCGNISYTFVMIFQCKSVSSRSTKSYICTNANCQQACLSTMDIIFQAAGLYQHTRPHHRRQCH